MNLWLVTSADVEGYSFCHLTIHSTREAAEKQWYTLRDYFVAQCEHYLRDTPNDEMFHRIKEELLAGSPETGIDSIHDHPVMQKFELDGQPQYPLTEWWLPLEEKS